MRLDVFLKLSRLVPRRTLAQEFCDKGLIAVNGVAAKSSKEVKSGDRIGIRRRNTLTTISVADVPARKQLSKTEAQNIYEIISTETIEDADLLA
ncbi:MAG: RNA-binding S4 domain-containing protein [Acidobacteria bacterium]|nr:RNA-binding S4 domain-containing protein [Acidobacteriota bacterium]